MNNFLWTTSKSGHTLVISQFESTIFLHRRQAKRLKCIVLLNQPYEVHLFTDETHWYFVQPDLILIHQLHIKLPLGLILYYIHFVPFAAHPLFYINSGASNTAISVLKPSIFFVQLNDASKPFNWSHQKINIPHRYNCSISMVKTSHKSWWWI